MNIKLSLFQLSLLRAFLQLVKYLNTLVDIQDFKIKSFQNQY